MKDILHLHSMHLSFVKTVVKRLGYLKLSRDTSDLPPLTWTLVAHIYTWTQIVQSGFFPPADQHWSSSVHHVCILALCIPKHTCVSMGEHQHVCFTPVHAITPDLLSGLQLWPQFFPDVHLLLLTRLSSLKATSATQIHAHRTAG